MKTKRFVGIDIHKQHVVIAAVDQHQKVLLSLQKIANQKLASWVNKHLNPSDMVAIEATTNSWTFHDQLKPLHEYRQSCRLSICYPQSGCRLHTSAISGISPNIAGN